MSEVLALDIGLTTGFAVLSAEGLDCTGTILHENLGNDLMALVSYYTPEHIVAEKPLVIRGQLGKMLERAIEEVNYALNGRKGFQWVNPSEWKDSRFFSAKTPKKITQHEKDAYRIGLWYLNKLQSKQ